MSDLTYFDGDYFDGKYFTVVKEVTVGVSDYFETDYILPDYFFRPPNTTFGLNCSAFSFVSKWNDSLRPIDWDFYQHTTATGSTLSEDFTLNTSLKAEGTSSLTMPDLEGNGNGSRSYYAESDVFLQTGDTTGKSWVLDFWHYLEYTDADNIMILTIDSAAYTTAEPPISDSSRLLQIYKISGDLQARVYNNSGTSVDLIANSTYEPYDDFNFDAWNHISIVYDHTAGEITMRLNKDDDSSQFVWQASDSFDTALSGNCRIRLHQPALNYNAGASPGFRSGIVGFDAVRFAVDTTNYTRTVGDLENTLDTYILARFNNSFDDDLSIAFDGVANLSSTHSLSADATQVLGLLATLDSVASISATASHTEAVSADLNSAASISVDVETSIRVESTLDSAFGITIGATKNASAAAGVDSTADITVAGSRNRTVATDLTGVFTPVISAIANLQNDITLSTVAALTVVAGIAKVSSSSLSSSATVDITATRGKTTSSTLDSTTTADATPTRIFAGASALSSSATFSSTAQTQANVASEILSEFGITTEGAKAVQVDSTLATLVSLQTLAGINAAAASNLAAVFNQTTRAYIIDLDSFIYTIPREIRTQSIVAEDRLHNVAEETRTLTVDAEDRIHSITEELRTYTIEGID